MQKSMVNSFVDLDKHEEPSENDIRKNRRRRNRGEKCYIPDKFFAKFTSASLGCFRLEFSHNGRFLAAACTEKDSRTCIKFFEVEDTIDEVFRYRGHTNLIHEITWSENDQYMASCSSDFTTKIWAVPYETNDKITEEQSEQQFLVATLNHPSYVYSVKFHPKSKPVKKYVKIIINVFYQFYKKQKIKLRIC
ncbi:WD40-repeat-containing domain [Pseudocohnilembus persalinus]|uniref:WD40-repeat-containing domain n=1 Tax=Pseudocohnilembus persalinus TaxID=266149 RepID=A0A0V0QTC1_PSEPJ|nr:WD40-repeat-containing domain [Pseudocohnilembus persalinus]|eukprot:KRX05441.1 WD40-repeat-containing domain [Pseudocohnilembus persalinus]